MKQENLIIAGVLAFVAWTFMNKKAAPTNDPIDPPYTPPPVPTGFLTIEDRRAALLHYSNDRRINWSAALPKLTDTEIETLYTYIFEILLAGKRVPAAIQQRINLIKYKYGLTI